MATRSDIKYEKSVSILRNRVSVSKTYFNVLPKELRTLSFYVTGLEKLRQVESVRLSLENALKKGMTFKEWQTSFDAETWGNLTKARQQLVFRTNLISAYNGGTRLAGIENKDVTPYFLYSAINDSRTRPAHLELDGVVRPVDDDYWDTRTPSLGYNCRCSIIPIDKETASEQRAAQNKSGFITSKQELTSIEKKGGKPDKGFDTPSKPGNFTKGVVKNTNKAIDSLPNTSPYKKRFKDQIQNVDRKVAIWFKKVEDIFK